MRISALDETGNPCDWSFIYKVPQLNAGAGTDKTTGYEYVYYDSTIDADNGGISKSPYLLNGDKGALNNTLDSVFNDNQDKSTGWILYNDEMPLSVHKPDDNNKGHTKGVIAFNTETQTGFSLLHSSPLYADPKATTDPTPKYGQTYLCVSLDLATCNLIAAQMATHQEPQVFDANVVDLPISSALYALSQPLSPKVIADSNVLSLATIGSMPFKVIAKNRQWDKDFWNGLVGPTLNDDMDDETWIRGPIPPVADTDGIHKTFDIKYIDLGQLRAHWAWPETNDHAKWGITVNQPWICIADINRMISQRNRGGGCIAFQNRILWQALTRAGLILAPLGHSRTEAHALIKKHHSPDVDAPPKQ